ncbi:hypothetical protein TNCV_1111761 [Trichonephila clavipes]|nr:hypothetical protein TNCV_1111761 [Trichonephila clavipes]
MVSLKRDSQCLSPQAGLELIYRPTANVTLQGNARTAGHRLRDSEPRPSDEDETGASILLSKFPHLFDMRTYSLDCVPVLGGKWHQYSTEKTPAVISELCDKTKKKQLNRINTVTPSILNTAYAKRRHESKYHEKITLSLPALVVIAQQPSRRA